MASISPFRAIRYDPDKINGPLPSVVAPPYDVIDYEEQNALLKRSPHNVVRLILGRQYDGDGPTDNRYTRAADRLESWLDEGILLEDPLPALYVYEQTYRLCTGHPPQAATRVRRGMLAALKIEPFGEGCVYAHEETFSSHKADRFNLMRACRANLSPIFGLVPDPDEAVAKLLAQAVDGKRPAVEIAGEDGAIDRLWVVDDAACIEKLTRTLEPRKVFIADGHHRYETACNYRDERRANDSSPNIKGPKPYDFVLMMCVPMSDPGLFILPTHRLVKNGNGCAARALFDKAAELFEKKDATDAELAALAEGGKGPAKFGFVFATGEKAILTAKPAVAAAMKQICADKSDAWRELDVAILHRLILGGMLGIGEAEGKKKGLIAYTKSVDDVLKEVPAGAYSLGVVMRPTRLQQVCVVSETGERMPHKSTYFYPKLLSGLVMRKL